MSWNNYGWYIFLYMRYILRETFDQNNYDKKLNKETNVNK